MQSRQFAIWTASWALIAGLTAAETPGADSRVLPAGTTVPVQLLETVGSNTHVRGAQFKMAVARDVILGDRVVIPRGSPVLGEVIHAAKSSYGGRPGELILTARSLQLGDRSIKLRSLQFNAVGKSRSGAAATTATAGAAAVEVASQSRDLISTGASSGSAAAGAATAAALTVIIRGRRAVVETGTELLALTSADETLTGGL